MVKKSFNSLQRKCEFHTMMEEEERKCICKNIKNYEGLCSKISCPLIKMIK